MRRIACELWPWVKHGNVAFFFAVTLGKNDTRRLKARNSAARLSVPLEPLAPAPEAASRTKNALATPITHNPKYLSFTLDGTGADGPRPEGGRRILLDNSRVYVRFLPFVGGRVRLTRISDH